MGGGERGGSLLGPCAAGGRGACMPIVEIDLIVCRSTVAPCPYCLRTGVSRHWQALQLYGGAEALSRGGGSECSSMNEPSDPYQYGWPAFTCFTKFGWPRHPFSL